MLALIVTAKIKPAERERFLSVIEDDAICSVRDEPGCVRFEVLQDRDDQDTYYFFEVYKDEAALPAHRVVTGHTPDGKATVSIEDTLTGTSGRPNVTVANIWTTEGFPVDNTGDKDQGQREVGTTLAGGTVFRIVQFAPGNAE